MSEFRLLISIGLHNSSGMLEQKTSSNSAFSLIELLLVMGIVGIFAGGAMSAAAGIQRWQAMMRSRTVINELETAIRHFRADNGHWPGIVEQGEININSPGGSLLESLGPYLESVNPEKIIEDGFSNQQIFLLVDVDGDNWIEKTDFRALESHLRPHRLRQRVAIYSLNASGQVAACNW